MGISGSWNVEMFSIKGEDKQDMSSPSWRNPFLALGTKVQATADSLNKQASNAIQKASSDVRQRMGYSDPEVIAITIPSSPQNTFCGTSTPSSTSSFSVGGTHFHLTSCSHGCTASIASLQAWHLEKKHTPPIPFATTFCSVPFQICTLLTPPFHSRTPPAATNRD